MKGIWMLLLLLTDRSVDRPGTIFGQRRGAAGQDWRTADRSSAGIAPAPSEAQEAIVSVWAARAFNWRGALAAHTWIATKPENGTHYMVHQVIGWRDAEAAM